jgi:hypothetical protein
MLLLHKVFSAYKYVSNLTFRGNSRLFSPSSVLLTIYWYNAISNYKINLFQHRLYP